jgi:methylated-DNA-[protein]-cysteine S-methyltransferase
MQTETVLSRPSSTAAHRHRRVPTVLGDLLLVAHGAALAGIYFPGHRYPPSSEFSGEPMAAEQPDRVLEDAAAQLDEYLAGTRQIFDLPLVTTGDPFSERVWAMLREIPYGCTTTY